MLFISNVQRLKHHWLSHDVKFNAGVSEAALAAFEQEFNVSLPLDLRDYFRTMNGMPEEETDIEMIRFWRLDEVKALPTGAPDYASADYIDSSESLFLFADYSLWAHAYAIRLLPTPSNKNEIFIVGGDSPMLLFKSFSELVDGYLTDKALMFGESSTQ